MITVQLHNLIFACKYNRRSMRKVTSSFEEVLYIGKISCQCKNVNRNVQNAFRYSLYIGKMYCQYKNVNGNVQNAFRYSLYIGKM